MKVVWFEVQSRNSDGTYKARIAGDVFVYDSVPAVREAPIYTGGNRVPGTFVNGDPQRPVLLVWRGSSVTVTPDLTPSTAPSWNRRRFDVEEASFVDVAAPSPTGVLDATWTAPRPIIAVGRVAGYDSNGSPLDQIVYWAADNAINPRAFRSFDLESHDATVSCTFSHTNEATSHTATAAAIRNDLSLAAVKPERDYIVGFHNAEWKANKFGANLAGSGVQITVWEAATGRARYDVEVAHFTNDPECSSNAVEGPWWHGDYVLWTTRDKAKALTSQGDNSFVQSLRNVLRFKYNNVDANTLINTTLDEEPFDPVAGAMHDRFFGHVVYHAAALSGFPTTYISGLVSHKMRYKVRLLLYDVSNGMQWVANALQDVLLCDVTLDGDKAMLHRPAEGARAWASGQQPSIIARPPTRLLQVTRSDSTALWLVSWWQPVNITNTYRMTVKRLTISGTIDGSNTVFTLNQINSPIASSRKVYKNHVLLTAGVDYTITAGGTITFTTAPVPGDYLFGTGHHEAPTPAHGGLCDTFTLAAVPLAGTLTVYVDGVVRTDYTLVGATITFAVEIQPNQAVRAGYEINEQQNEYVWHQMLTAVNANTGAKLWEQNLGSDEILEVTADTSFAYVHKQLWGGATRFESRNLTNGNAVKELSLPWYRVAMIAQADDVFIHARYAGTVLGPVSGPTGAVDSGRPLVWFTEPQAPPDAGGRHVVTSLSPKAIQSSNSDPIQHLSGKWSTDWVNDQTLPNPTHFQAYDGRVYFPQYAGTTFSMTRRVK